jgi:hypothetical protein
MGAKLVLLATTEGTAALLRQRMAPEIAVLDAIILQGWFRVVGSWVFCKPLGLEVEPLQKSGTRSASSPLKAKTGPPRSFSILACSKLKLQHGSERPKKSLKALPLGNRGRSQGRKDAIIP